MRVVLALAKRDFKRWFGNPIGYVFITVFVLISTALLYSIQIKEDFFNNNLANLDILNAAFPYLLLFLVPAITMTLWAGERKDGTDELLLTLPADETQLLIGKFLAAVGIYSVALLFSVTQVFLLAHLGDPDWGLILGNYIGFWCLGVAFISAAMTGSMLSDNVVVAFIFGALLCALIVIAEALLTMLVPSMRTSLEGYGPVSFFQEFGRGVISLPALILYAGMTTSFLSLNRLFLRRRHWSVHPVEGFHLTLRFLCILGCALALTVIGANRARVRLDSTSAGLHSLSPGTLRIIDELPGDRTVFIQAFVSPTVPTDYVRTRRTLLDLLQEYDSRGGDRIVVRVVETEPFTPEAREAEQAFNIRYVPVGDKTGKTDKVYLGLAFTCGEEEIVIPFLDKGLSVEYELTRSLRVAAGTKRKKVGILETDAKLFGGFDFRSMQSSPEWDIVRELKLQYDVARVSPETDYEKGIDVLIVPLASTLMQEEMNRLAMYIKAGNPVLLIDDPFVAVLGIAVTDPKGAGQQSMFGPPPQTKPKGNIAEMLRSFNIRWPETDIVLGSYNPHPKAGNLREEILFICKGPESRSPFNERERITSGLQEIVCIFAGHLKDAGRDSEYDFIPLLQTSPKDGVTKLDDFLPRGMFGGRQRNPDPDVDRNYSIKTVACLVKGKAPAAAKPVNMICIADLDILSGGFFQLRRMGETEFNLDNVQFLLNCIDELAGDPSFIELRKRRPEHRTLTRIEEQEKRFDNNLISEKEKAESKAKKDLADAQKRLDDRIADITRSAEGDQQEKEFKIESYHQVENRKLEIQKKTIEDEKNRAIEDAEGEKRANVREIRSFYRFFSPILAVIPTIFLGLVIWLRKTARSRGRII